MIPKEQLTAYQRWEMASFDEATPRNTPSPAAITNEELAAVREQARREGYTKGLAEGYQTGHDEGLTNGLTEGHEQTAQLITQLSTLAANFSAELAEADKLIAADLLDLALNIAQTMLKTALPIHPELVLPVIHEAIHELPVLQRNAKLILNPDDARLVKEHLADVLKPGGWNIIEDSQIEAGGCRIDTSSNQIDATLATRWQRLATTLGKDAHWLKT